MGARQSPTRRFSSSAAQSRTSAGKATEASGRRRPRRPHREDGHAGLMDTGTGTRASSEASPTARTTSRATPVIDNQTALYLGVVAVQSQGIEKGDVTYQIRAEQEAGRLGGARLHIAGRGIGAPSAGPGGAAYAGIAYEVTTEDQARKAVQELAARKVNLEVPGSSVPERPRAAAAAESVQGHHRRRPQARPAGERARVLLHGCRGPCERRHRLPRASGSRQGDGRRAGGVRSMHHNVYVQPNLSPEWNTYWTAALAAGRRSADGVAAGVARRR